MQRFCARSLCRADNRSFPRSIIWSSGFGSTYGFQTPARRSFSAIALLGLGACDKSGKGLTTKGPARRSQSRRLQGRPQIHFAADAGATHLRLLECDYSAEFPAWREDRSIHRQRAGAESVFHRNVSEPRAYSRYRLKFTAGQVVHVSRRSALDELGFKSRDRYFAHRRFSCGPAETTVVRTSALINAATQC